MRSALLGMLDKVFPILLRAKVRVDCVVILGIISVVRTGVKDRVEVNRIHPQRLEVIQVLINAL